MTYDCLIDIDEPIPAAATVGATSGAAEPPAESVQMISEMGFTPQQAKKSVKANCASRSFARCASDQYLTYRHLHQNNDPERAIDWLFSHPDDNGDEDISAVADPTTNTPSGPGGSSSLPANYRLKAFISHKGPSVHSGHYVAHVRVSDGSWVFFNDEKVVRADSESLDQLKPYAYLYIFERV